MQRATAAEVVVVGVFAKTLLAAAAVDGWSSRISSPPPVWRSNTVTTARGRATDKDLFSLCWGLLNISDPKHSGFDHSFSRSPLSFYFSAALLLLLSNRSLSISFISLRSPRNQGFFLLHLAVLRRHLGWMPASQTRKLSAREHRELESAICPAVFLSGGVGNLSSAPPNVNKTL